MVSYKEQVEELQKFLDSHFDAMIQHGNLDEIREEVMRFEDLKYKGEILLVQVRSHRYRLALAMEKELRDCVHTAQEHSTIHEKLQRFAQGLSMAQKEFEQITTSLAEKSNQPG